MQGDGNNDIIKLERWRSQFESPILGNQLLMIESAAFTSSVLERWGYRQHYVIGMVIERIEDAEKLAEKLGIFQKRPLSVGISPSKFEQTFNAFHDDLCIVIYEKARYTNENLDLVFSQCFNGGDGILKYERLILLVFVEGIPDEYLHRITLVLEMNSRELDRICEKIRIDCLKCLKDAILTRSQILEYEIKRQPLMIKEDLDTIFWSSVINLIALAFTGDNEQVANIIKVDCELAISRGYECVDTYRWSEMIPSYFCQALDTLIPHACSFLSEKQLSEMNQNDFSSVVIYDTDSYYISELLFSKICNQLNSYCTENQLKAALNKNGIICSQGKARMYWTVKKMIPSMGKFVRFIKLNRKTLEAEREQTFVDLSRIRSNKEEDLGPWTLHL